MKPGSGLVVSVAVAGCISPVMHFGSGKSAHQAQHDTLEEFMPAGLSTEGTWPGPVEDATIRVYADDEYRAQNLKWQQAFGEELTYANAVLGPQFGVHLVADYRAWNHHAPGNGLPEDLEELRAVDRADGPDHALSVIGLTSSLGLVSATFDLLGYADVPGQYVMLRGYADLEERKAFARAFPDLSSDERDDALEARRRHKTAAVLLHELGHNLGAPHEVSSETLMNAVYSEHAAAFSSDAHAIVQRTLDQRLGRATTATPTAGAPPAAPPALKVHKTLLVQVTADAVMVDTNPETESELTVAFSAYAALDPDTEVILHKDRGVPSSRLVDVIDRAKAAGLTKFTIE